MEMIGEFPWHFTGVISGDLSPDGKLAATHGMDNRVRLWEAPGGREITHWEIRGGYSGGRLRFSGDGAFLDCPDFTAYRDHGFAKSIELGL